MSAFNLQWSPASLQTLETERYAHIFAIVTHGELVFLGRAHREDLTTLIAENLSKLELDPQQVQVHLGRLREVGTGRISEEVVDTLLSVLVYAKKPKYNRVGKYRYLGTMDLELSNLGSVQLPARLRTQGSVVIVQSASTKDPKQALVPQS